MKKIILSVAVIAAVAAVVFGVTTAFFSDTETSKGNTFSTGVIDITVGPGTEWSQGWHIEDMKPCETGYITFNIQNPGDNPVNVWKTIKNITTSDEPVNEPECVYNNNGYYGVWDSDSKACDVYNESPWWRYEPKSNLQDWMYYDLSVFVPITDNQDGGWWQIIYKDKDKVVLSNVGKVFLGMVPAKGSMKVTQSYHLAPTTENWAQADTMTFDIEIYAEQLTGTLVLENKTGAPDWQILGNDTIKGTLTYNLTSPTFDYDFTATGLTDGTYQLIYYPDGWTSNKQVKLIGGIMTVFSDGKINVTGKSENLGIDLPDWTIWADQNHPEGAKIWLVPTGSLSGTGGNTLSWTNTDKFLFETALITYDDTNN